MRGGIRIGVGIGIGIESDFSHPILVRSFADGIATPAEPRQHGHDAIEHDLGFGVLLRRQATANLQHVLDRAALQRRPTRNLESPAPVTICRLAVPFRDVQGDRLRSAQQLLSGVSMPFEPFTEAIRSADVLEGRPVYVESLVAETHVSLDSDSDSDVLAAEN